MKLAKTVWLIVICTSAILLSGCAPISDPVASPTPSPSLSLPDFKTYDDHQKVFMTIGDSKPLEIEIVNSNASIAQGLSDRDTLGADGMLFITEWEGPIRFWMKDMKFNLDMVWIKNDTVVEITKNVPAPNPNTPLEKLPKYNAHQPINKVLEVEAGNVEAWGIEVGDTLRLQ